MRANVANPDPSNFAQAYERLLVTSLFRPWAELLVDRVGPRPGDCMLDVACGTGIVARVARPCLGQDGCIVGVDMNPQMLAVARAVEPDIVWREGSAGALPIATDETFDVVTCQQGLQFFPDKALAVREMRRVLAPGGRLGIATWRPVEEMPLLVELQRIVEKHIGPVIDSRHGFGDDRTLGALLTEAGFADPQVEVASLPVRFSDASVFVRMNAMALVGMSARGKAMTEEVRSRTITEIVEESQSVLRPHLDESELVLELRSNLAIAEG